MSASSQPDSQPSIRQNNLTGESVKYRQLFPWLRMFDVFWIAIDLRNLLLASVAVLLLSAGNWCFQQLPFAILPEFASAEISNEVDLRAQWPWTLPFQAESSTGCAKLAWQFLQIPIKAVVHPVRVMFLQDASWSQLAMAWTQLFWTLGVAALFGGAITRIATVEIGGERRLSLAAALRFSVGKFLSFLTAPLLPLVGIGALWSLCLLGGFVGRIPGVGPWIVGLFWGIAILLGFLMALILIGAAAGWPLAFATISVEGSDALDGLSRSFGYVYAKPAYYLMLTVLAAGLGTIATAAALSLAHLSLYLARWAVAWGEGSTEIAQNPLAVYWTGLFVTLIAGFVYSYFWSAVTMAYLLLRRSIDCNDFSEIYLPEQEQDELSPLVEGAEALPPDAEA